MRTIYRYRSKALAAIIALMVGWLGLHRFYTGHPGLASAWLITAVCLLVVYPPATPLLTLAALVDLIHILCRRREWFRRVYAEVEDGAEEGLA